MNLDFESVLARSPNPYVILDASLVIQWANAAYLSATESRWDEIKQRGIFEAFPSEGLSPVEVVFRSSPRDLRS
jgi:hypothetical protein